MAHNSPSILKDFPWGITSERAAMLVAEGHKTTPTMAEELGIAPATLKDWRGHPEFKQRVKSIIEAAAAEAMETGVLGKQGRIEALQTMYQKLQQIVDERANDATWAHIPGWRTGFLAHDRKALGSGNSMEIVDKFEDNMPLVSQIRDTLKQIAQEQGQWVEKQDTTHVITRIEVVHEDMDPRDM